MDTHNRKMHIILYCSYNEHIPVSGLVLEAVRCIGQSCNTTLERSSSHVDNKVSIWHSSSILSTCWAVGGACSFTRRAGLKIQHSYSKTTSHPTSISSISTSTLRWSSGIGNSGKAQKVDWHGISGVQWSNGFSSSSSGANPGKLVMLQSLKCCTE